MDRSANVSSSYESCITFDVTQQLICATRLFKLLFAPCEVVVFNPLLFVFFIRKRYFLYRSFTIHIAYLLRHNYKKRESHLMKSEK